MIFFASSVTVNDNSRIIFERIVTVNSLLDIRTHAEVHVEFNVTWNVGAYKRRQKRNPGIWKPDRYCGQLWMLDCCVDCVDM